MVIVIFKVRTRARLRKPIDERRILSARNTRLTYRQFHSLSYITSIRWHNDTYHGENTSVSVTEFSDCLVRTETGWKAQLEVERFP